MVLRQAENLKITKSFGSCQPARIAQADISRDFSQIHLTSFLREHSVVLRGSVVKCLTRNPEVLGSSRSGSSGFFVGVSLGETLQSPSLVLVKAWKDMNNVSCRHD